MNNDLISRSELKKAIETWDKFACLPDTRLMPFRMLNEPEKDYEPYVHLRDILNAIDNAPTVLHDNYSMGYQDGVRKVLSERPQGDWIIKDEVICECSLCGYSTNYIRLLSPKRSGLNYCAYCGAKMERSDNE